MCYSVLSTSQEIDEIELKPTIEQLQTRTNNQWSDVSGTRANNGNNAMEFLDMSGSHTYTQNNSEDARIADKSPKKSPKQVKNKKVKNEITPIQNAKAPIKMEPDQSLFVCELCGHTSRSKGVYDNHYERKHMNNTYQCDLCGER